MDKERLREFISSPVLVILLVVLAVAGIITYGVSINMAEDKSNIVNSLDIESVTKNKDGQLVVKLTDYKASQDEAYKKAEKKLQKAANGETENTDKIKNYFESRYNFDGKEKDNLDDIVSKIEKDCSNDFLGEVKSDIRDSKKEDSTCEIKRIYITGTDVKELNAYSTSIYYIFDIKINDTESLYKTTMVVSNGTWVIDDIKKISDLEE